MISLGPVTLLQPLWLLPALACLVAAWRLRSHAESHGWEPLLARPILEFLLPARLASGWMAHWPMLVAGLTCLALMQPATRRIDDQALQHSNAWVFVADVSRSMGVSDVIPSRLAAMRDAMLELARLSQGRAIALIVYAGDAFVIVPPAFDTRLLQQHVALLEPGVVPLEGSNAARALSLASTVVADSDLLFANLFVFSDTGGLGPDAEAAARYLAGSGHRVDLVRIGTSEGDPAVAIDARAGERLVDAGQGRLWASSTLGVLPLQAMADSALRAEAHAAGLQALVWHDQSHWLLLAGIPMLLAWFWQRPA